MRPTPNTPVSDNHPSCDAPNPTARLPTQARPTQATATAAAITIRMTDMPEAYAGRRYGDMIRGPAAMLRIAKPNHGDFVPRWTRSALTVQVQTRAAIGTRSTRVVCPPLGDGQPTVPAERPS